MLLITLPGTNCSYHNPTPNKSFCVCVCVCVYFIFRRERERERERESLSMSGGGAERGRHRILSRLQAPGCQHTVRRHGARTFELWDHDLNWSLMINQLGHPCTPTPNKSWIYSPFPMPLAFACRVFFPSFIFHKSNQILFLKTFLKSILSLQRNWEGGAEISCIPLLPPMCSFFNCQHHSPKCTLFTKDEPTLTHHVHPKSIVYLTVRSWCCVFCGCGQMFNGIHPSL